MVLTWSEWVILTSAPKLLNVPRRRDLSDTQYDVGLMRNMW